MTGAPRLMFQVQNLLGIGHQMRAAAIARACVARGFRVDVLLGGPDGMGVDWGAARLHPLPPVRALDQSFRILVDASGNMVDDAWLAARGRLLLDKAETLRPDILLLEGFPFARRRFHVELTPLIERMGARGIPVACSIREILQRPGKPGRVAEAIGRAERHLDHILVHGDPAFLPVTDSYPELAGLAGRVIYTGFVAPDAPAAADIAAAPQGEILVSAGGGAVGGRLIRAALGAARLGVGGADRRWRILVGPNLPPEDRPDPTDLPGHVRVEPNRTDFRALLAACDLSISQAGYNTVMDLAVTRPRALLCPFAGDGGEQEQPLRAARLAALGLADCLSPDRLTAQALALAIDKALAKQAPVSYPFQINGAAQSAEILWTML